MEDVLKSGYYESSLGFDIIEWFLDEPFRLEHKMFFYLKTKKKYNILSEGDEDHYRKNDICQFCEKEIISDKVRDHYPLTGKNRQTFHQKCNTNVTQKQSNFVPFVFHNFSDSYCHHVF